MSKIQVHSISGIEEYGTSVQTFGNEFEIASSDTIREFNTSLEGEQAEAINAFFEKLNQIQNTIFSVAPGAIRTYGQGISDFAEALKGLGFTDIAYTEDDAMDNLTRSLEVNQRDEIQDVKDALVRVMEEAVEVMGDGDASMPSFDSKADDLISEEVMARKETHQGIKTAHESLESAIQTSQGELENLIALTQNARAVASIPVGDVLAALQRGDLTADKVEYLSAVYTDGDVAVIKTFFEESKEEPNKFFETLAMADVTEVGLPVMMIVAHRLEQAVDGKEVEGLKAFFETLSNRPVKEVQDYTAKLSSGIDTIVDGINQQGAKLIATLPRDYNETNYQAYLAETESSKERLKALKASSVRYGKLNNILQFMNEEQFGERKITIPNTSLGDGKIGDFVTFTKRNIKKDSFTITNGELEFHVQDLGVDRKNVSETWSTSSKSELDTTNSIVKIDNLRKQKELLWLDSSYKIAKDFLPGNKALGFFVDIMESAASTPDEKEALKAVGKLGLKHADDVTLKRFNNLKNYSSKLAERSIEYFEQSEKIDKQIAKENQNILAEKFDIGGSAIKEGESSYKSIVGDSRYDFEGNLYMADLEKNGLRGHYFRQFAKGSETDLKTALSKLKEVDDILRGTQTSGSYDKDMKSLFMGEGKQSLDNFSGEKLKNGMDALKKLTADSDNYRFLPDNYGDTEKTYFNELVGIGAQPEK